MSLHVHYTNKKTFKVEILRQPDGHTRSSLSVSLCNPNKLEAQETPSPDHFDFIFVIVYYSLQ